MCFILMHGAALETASCDLSALSRRMTTKEHKPVGPKQRKAIKFSDSLVEVAYVCDS
jgi:hypothetical protein